MTDKIDFKKIENSMVEACFNGLAFACNQEAKRAGWWDKDRNVGEMIALVHSELSEALEADRKNKNDDHLTHCRGYDVELVDAMIRLFDMLGHRIEEDGTNVGRIFCEKLEYNRNRADHKRENRKKEGGKKY